MIIAVNEIVETVSTGILRSFRFLEKNGKKIRKLKQYQWERLRKLPHKTILIGEDRCEMHFIVSDDQIEKILKKRRKRKR